MKNQFQVFALILMSSLFLTSCFSDPKEEEKDDNSISIKIGDGDGESMDIKIEGKKDVEKALNELKNSLEELGNELKGIEIDIKDKNGDKIEVVSAKELKEALPNRIAGLDQTANSSEKSGMFGFNVSQAEATYQEDDERVRVTIVDIGSVGKLASKFTNMASFESEKEDSKGNFERMIEIKGHKAIEKYKVYRNQYELVVFVDSRFVVEMEGRNVKQSKMKSVMEDIVDDLEDL
jgi:hypothetical protein